MTRDDEIDLQRSQIQVLHVAVNYNTTEECLAFADSFRRSRSTNSATSLIVVDNSDGERLGELPSLMGDGSADIRCAAAPRNLGYFGGASFGIEVARGIFRTSQWTIVSNIDLSYDCAALERALRKHDPEKVAAIAPRIISSANGRDLNPFMSTRPSRLRMHGYRLLFRSYRVLQAYTWFTQWMHSTYPSPRRPARMTLGEPIYAAHGCFFILSAGYFARGGSLEHAPFLFGEEVTIAEQARRIELPIICDPEIIVTHRDHASVGNLPGRVVHRYHRRSAEWVASEYFGWDDRRALK